MALPRPSASSFGTVLGLGGLGGAWRIAAHVWGVTPLVGEALFITAGVTWLSLIFLYGSRWFNDREAVAAEFTHPVQCCFVGLVGVSTSMIAIGIIPHSFVLGEALVAVGASFTITFGIWRTGSLWKGGRTQDSTTAVLYLPLVAGMFMTAYAISALGFNDWGRLAFGAGLFSWLAIESVLLNRLYMGTPLPLPLRPTLGIQLAPPAVGAVALLSISDGEQSLFAGVLVGYALLQALILVRMTFWITEQPFATSYWSFTFGTTALAAASLRMVENGGRGSEAFLAPILFAAANILVGLVTVLTVRSWLMGATPPGTPPEPAGSRRAGRITLTAGAIQSGRRSTS